MRVSWYSSVEACLASSRTAGGSTIRATNTATNIPDPSDSVTLQQSSQEFATQQWKGSGSGCRD